MSHYLYVNSVRDTLFPHRRHVNFMRYLTYILLSAGVLLFLSGYFPSFPDYPGYEHYILSGDYEWRFESEPLSMILMHLTYELGLGATSYFWVCALILLAGSIWFVERYAQPPVAGVMMLVLLTPAMLVAIQTPRYAMALGFFFFALGSNGVWAAAFLSLSLLSHFVMGVFGLFLYVALSFFGLRLFLLLLVFLVLGFLLIKTGALFPGYEKYFDNTELRGRGRLILILGFFLFYLLSRGSVDAAVGAIFGMVLTFSVLFWMTPYVHRLLHIPLMIIAVSWASRHRGLGLDQGLFTIYLLGSITITLLVLMFGLFGFEWGHKLSSS